MKPTFSLVIAGAIVLSALGDDLIVLKNGETTRGSVMEYENGALTFTRSDGKTITGSINQIQRIVFDNNEGHAKPAPNEEDPLGENINRSSAMPLEELLKKIRSEAPKELHGNPLTSTTRFLEKELIGKNVLIEQSQVLSILNGNGLSLEMKPIKLGREKFEIRPGGGSKYGYRSNEVNGLFVGVGDKWDDYVDRISTLQTASFRENKVFRRGSVVSMSGIIEYAKVRRGFSNDYELSLRLKEGRFK
jgi:hypothetical protein